MGVYNTEKNAVKEYIDWLQDRIGKENIEALASGKLSGLDDNAPFLSVVMRTQGKRIEMLREAVLCLWAQTCQDFEVLIMGHNLDGEARIEHLRQ